MSLKTIQNAIGKRLKNLRLSKNFSQEYVSLEVNISRDHLSNLENGKFPANIKTLHKLSIFYEVDFEYFFIGLKR